MSHVLDLVVKGTEGEQVTLGEILRVLGVRSYGPAFMIVALISMIPPISITPGLPVLTGALFLLLAVQLLLHRPYPWLPGRLLRHSFPREKLLKAVERARPWAERIGKVIRPRLSFMLRPPFLNLIALVIIGLAGLTFLLSPLPGGENVAAAAVFLFGLALTAKDGLLAFFGLAVTGAAVWLLVYLWPTIVQGVTGLLGVLGG
ncbi:MAG TPA: exopolysaccharide biosynthesis protein [Gemmataceae bacterium]